MAHVSPELRSPRFALAKLSVIILLSSLAGVLSVVAGSSALIVTGLSGNETDSERFQKLAEASKAGLVKRGIAPEKVTVLMDAKRDAILQTIASSARESGNDDDVWLIFYGHAGMSAGNIPAFQVHGPRLTAQDLQKALETVHARKWIFLGTEASGAFLPYLKSPGTNALAATQETGEVNQPRLPEHWTAALLENPQATFPELAALATNAVEAETTNLSLALGEHGRLLDGATGDILSAPYGATQLAKTAAPKLTTKNPALSGPEAIEIPKNTTQAEFQFQEATAETKQLIASAQQIENSENFAALVLRQELGVTVNSDRTAVHTSRLRVYLAKEESLNEWANFSFRQAPPAEISTVEAARIILPDGSSYVFNPARISTVRADNEDRVTPVSTLYFPQAIAGSLVEIAWKTTQNGQSDLPEFYEEIEVQRSVPVLETKIFLKLPAGKKYQSHLANLEVAPAVSEAGLSQVLEWNLPKLAAYEPLPFDPPRREQIVWLGVSSLASWQDFTDWFIRISAGSETVTPIVAAKAKEIAEKFPSQPERIRAVFEFVSSLRYIALESGIQGFRPRTPEQVLNNRYGDCKDKANLICALLRSMEIPAQLALINRGSSTERQFPGWQFNHALAYIPQGTGGLWLDATDQTTPFGFPAPGDVGRQALVFAADKADFREVTPPPNQATTVSDAWELREDPAGHWQGTLRRTFTGLAEYEIRSQVRDASPAQRAYFFSRMLAELLPQADATNFQIGDVSDLALPINLDCEVQSSGASAPTAALPFIDALSPLARSRDLVINDGQPWAYRQELVLHYLESQKPASPNLALQVTGSSLSLTTIWTDARTCRRIASLAISQPRIAPKDFVAFRTAIRTWHRSLSNP